MNFVKWKFQSQEITLWRCCCWQMWWRHGLFWETLSSLLSAIFDCVCTHFLSLAKLSCVVWLRCLCRNFCDLFHWHKTTATTLFYYACDDDDEVGMCSNSCGFLNTIAIGCKRKLALIGTRQNNNLNNIDIQNLAKCKCKRVAWSSSLDLDGARI